MLFFSIESANYKVARELGVVFEPVAENVHLLSHEDLVEFTRYYTNPCNTMESMFNEIILENGSYSCASGSSRQERWFNDAKNQIMKICNDRWEKIAMALIDLSPRYLILQNILCVIMRDNLTKLCEHYNHSFTKIFASYSFPLNFLSHYGKKVHRVQKFCEHYFRSVTQKVL